MASQQQASSRRSVFRRFTALEALQEIFNDRDSGEEDFGGGFDSDSEEEESDNNQHHPLLSDLVADDDGDIMYEPPSDESESDGSDTEAQEPMPSTSTAPPPVARRRGRGRARGRGVTDRRTTQRRGRGTRSTRVRQDELVSDWQPAADEPPNNISFLGSAGVKCDTEGFRPVNYMELFFNEDLISHLVIQTNLYATQYIDSHPNLPQFSRVRQWVPVDAEEIKKFLGLVLLMGIVKLPSIELYWSTKVFYRVPIFGVIMNRNRFQVSCFSLPLSLTHTHTHSLIHSLFLSL